MVAPEGDRAHNFDGAVIIKQFAALSVSDP